MAALQFWLCTNRDTECTHTAYRSLGKDNTHTHMQNTNRHKDTHMQTCHTHSLALIGACVGNSQARLAVGQVLPPLSPPPPPPDCSSIYLPHYIDTISQLAEEAEGVGVRGCCLRTHQADENGNVKLTLLAGSAQHDREAAHKASSGGGGVDVRHYPEVGRGEGREQRVGW